MFKYSDEFGDKTIRKKNLPFRERHKKPLAIVCLILTFGLIFFLMLYILVVNRDRDQSSVKLADSTSAEVVVLDGDNNGGETGGLETG